MDSSQPLRTSQALLADSIHTALLGVPLIDRVEYHTTIGSTNDRARQLAIEGAKEIVLISADEQTAGRGRQGRTWFTPNGTALAFSLLTRPTIAVQHAMRLTMLAGLAAVEGIEQATGLRLSLKWPNDVVSVNEDRTAKDTVVHPSSLTPHCAHAVGASVLHPLKVGGILTETAFEGERITYAIVGMGLNVNVDFSSKAELRDIAISLSQLIGNPIDRLAVLRSIVTSFVDHYEGLKSDERLRDAWASRLINLGRDVRVQIGDELIEGRSENVDADGALLLRTKNGQLHRLLSGDVTLHRINS